MVKAIISPDLVTHEFERGWGHNTRCGLQLEGHMVLEGGVVDCVECIGGSSHISDVDLVRGVEVEIDLAPFDENGRLLTRRPATLSYGVNQQDLVWNDIPEGTLVCGFAYLRKDGTMMRTKGIEALRMINSCTLEIERGKLVLVER